ncbi:hypothetical protein ABZW32_19580 [Streptomyces sp. NPDC004667]|uniref:hypothetical protein n=1 Tax=Streptomyces sp. NPDC004667 TaxID=3154285 RepID=UPI0033A5C66F
MDASGDERLIRTPRSGLRTATVLCAAAALAVAAVPAAARPAAPPEQDPVVLVDCFQQAQVRPDDYVLACGDGNNRLVRLHWDSWGRRTATATGIDMANDCRPDCATGRFRSYPVKVTLSDPDQWPAAPDLRRFTKIRLVYPYASPTPIPKDVTYKLDY